ncbi:hypothetical protein [Brevibacillus nitrificans]|uniref:hypothetical protein n=1 Tax=Brevibacillus nitrificans TaxID=651560 RepID=UPI0028566EBB|nr:hypothetical protein [Brevibacillus nitrificans]MDR7318999.1 hypothetical protein [Brevibacillus nitrificans]
MQPYQQYDPQQQQPYFPAEQGYQNIPEDQANPVFFRGRRSPDVYFPIVVPIQPWGWNNCPSCNPWNSWNQWNPWNPWNPWGGAGGWGGSGGGGWGGW